MRRVVSLFLPMWPTDRYRKNTGDAPQRDKPLVMATKIGPRRVIVAADKAAQDLSLRCAMSARRTRLPEFESALFSCPADVARRTVCGIADVQKPPSAGARARDQ